MKEAIENCRTNLQLLWFLLHREYLNIICPQDHLLSLPMMITIIYVRYENYIYYLHCNLFLIIKRYDEIFVDIESRLLDFQYLLG